MLLTKGGVMQEKNIVYGANGRIGGEVISLFLFLQDGVWMTDQVPGIDYGPFIRRSRT